MMSQVNNYKIRYNTSSQNDDVRWRLIENDNEILVSEVIIDGVVQTTKDWSEDIQDYKWHISCQGECEIKNGVAYIKTNKEKSAIKRHILKTISWRIVGTIDTMVLAWIVTGNPITGLKIGAFEVITKMILYFLHERSWYLFGRNIGKKI